MAGLKLPEKKSELETALRRIVSEGNRNLNIRKVEWLVHYYYLQGARRFRSLNFREGTVEAQFESTRGELDYRFELAVQKFQAEMGRRLRVDVSPIVDRTYSLSLDGLRRSSMAQATINAMQGMIDIEKLKFEAIRCQMMYGGGALAVWGQRGTSNILSDTSAGGTLIPVVEVIPPYELIPIPVDPHMACQIHGVIRHRIVPLSRLKDAGLKAPSAAGGWDSLETTTVSYSDNPQTLERMSTPTSEEEGRKAFRDGDGSEDAGATYKAVALSEVFLENYDGTLQRYIVYAGGKVLQDENWDDVDEKPMMPVLTFTDIPIGGFYGKAFVSLLLPTNIEIEYLLKATFENMTHLDHYGYLMVPTTEGINMEHFLQKGRKPKTVPYEPDLVSPEHKPYNIAPTNLGDMPTRVAEFGVSLMKEMAGHNEMMEGGAPGRVDSAQGLGFLWETSNTSLGPPLISLTSAFCRMYKALLGIARKYWPATKLAQLTMVDDALAGIIIDPYTGQVELDKNAVPHPTTVTFSVASQLPRSKAQRKQELVMMLQMGQISNDEFEIINQEEALGFPIPASARWENYRKAKLNNIILFGDGTTPGTIVASGEADIPEVHLGVLQKFMSRPEFSWASREVRGAFSERKKVLEAMIGEKYPEQLGYPEEEAAFAASQQAAPTAGRLGRPPARQ